MKRTAWIAIILIALLGVGAGTALAQQTAGNITGRVMDEQHAALPGVNVTAHEAATGFTRSTVTDGEGVYRLSALPVGTYDVNDELAASRPLDRKGVVVNVGQTVDGRLRAEGCLDVAESVTVTGETPLIETTDSVGRRRGGHRPHREPAAQRPPVRQPGRDDPRRRPRLPLRPDQEHAVLAADQRRQRPQRQLPDRRRRQQRRHGRRPAAALPARGDPGVQLRHLALEGRERPQQRRRDEHRHQERHQRPARQLLHAVPRQGDERADRRPRRTTSIDKQDYRRYQYGGSFGGPIVKDKIHYFVAVERTQQDTFQAVNTTGPVPDAGRHLRHAVPRERCST